MNTEKILLAIIAAASVAIAAKLWLAPSPVTHAAFLDLGEREKKGEKVDDERSALLKKIPWVWVRNQP